MAFPLSFRRLLVTKFEVFNYPGFGEYCTSQVAKALFHYVIELFKT